MKMQENITGTKRFAVGNIVGYNGMIGTVKKNCNNFKYWEVEFKDFTRILHYMDMDYLCKNQLENSKVTNADRIRNMSNDELALLIADSVDFFNCSVCSHISDNHCRDDCLPYIKKWLESEVRKD